MVDSANRVNDDAGRRRLVRTVESLWETTGLTDDHPCNLREVFSLIEGIPRFWCGE